jgi:hypothetical protein
MTLMSFFLTRNIVYSQNSPSLLRYENAYQELVQLLAYSQHDFQKATFIVENAYFDQGINQESFNQEIDQLVSLCHIVASQTQFNYQARDSIQMKLSHALFRVMTDIIYLRLTDTSNLYHAPYQYDFEDIYGDKDWKQTFVSKLLKTRQGNCHALVYLYKILANELGVKSHLALAPYHIYIKQQSQKIGWYNTELTSKTFPTDGWIKTSRYIHIDAIRNGIYMSALSEQESIALCVFDLAKGFERKFGGKHKEFIIKCCDLSLKYFPKNINAMLLKAEILKQQYETEMVKRHLTNIDELQSDEQYKAIWEEMRLLYLKMHQLGYRQIPKEVYEQWLKEIE